MSPDFPFSIQTLLRAPWNHRYKALVAFLVPVAFAAYALNYLPKSYRSDAMIFVRLGRESVSLDPTANTGSTIPVLESRENEVNSIRDMLYSSGLLEKVADRIGPDVVLGNAPLGEIPETFPDPPEEDSTDSPRQQAVKFLSEKVSVISSRKSSVLVATCEAASPELAQTILEVYLDAYKKMHSLAHQTPKSNQFFADQAILLQTQWQEAMARLSAAKEKAGVVSVEGMQENLKSQTNTIQSRRMEVEGVLSATTAKLQALQKLPKKNPMNARGVRDDLKAATSEMASLTAELEALKMQEKSLLGRAGKLNRDEVLIRQLEQEVSAAKSNFAQYQELHEQTRIEEALRASKFTNVRIVQEPSFVPKPVSPKRKVIAIAGLFVGVAGAILISLLFELFLSNRSNRSTTRQTTDDNEVPATPLDGAMASQGSLI